MSVLTICLPAYNRIDDLIYNLRILKEIIELNNLYEDVSIIISDNCSPGNTKDILMQELQLYKEIKLEVFYQDTNIGAVRNLIFTIEKAQTEFCMLLGDDDYINANYLKGVLAGIKNNKELTCVFPSVQNIYPNKEIIEGKGRDLRCKTRFYKKGFLNCCINYNRAHQLSGLTFKKERIVEQYYKKRMDNLYPQVFFMMLSCLRGMSLHITDYPVLVTLVDQSKKNWSYGSDGLLMDKFQNCVNLDLSGFKCSILEIIAIINTKYLLRDIGFKVIPKIIDNKDTTFLASAFLLFFMPYILLEKYLKKVYWKIFK